MSRVAVIPTEPAVDAAWERYRVLVDRANRDTRLWADRPHCEAIIRAHEEFKEAFIAQDRAA